MNSQSRLDALNDAETLRRFLEQHLYDVPPAYLEYVDGRGHTFAHEAARAAFRAVPGLRGE